MKKMIVLFFIGIFVIGIETGVASFEKTYGGTNDDGGFSVQQILDGGYIIAGGTSFYGSGEADVYLIKVDYTGATQWTKTYGGTNDDGGVAVQQTSDDGYIIAGYTESYGVGGSDVYLIKVDNTGATQWTKTYGGMNDDFGYSVQQTSDGGYIIAGQTDPLGTGINDVYLIKVDSTGATQWIKTYGGTNYDGWGYPVQQTSDDGYIIAGVTSSYGAGGVDVYLLKVENTGATEWSRTYGGTNDDCGYSVQQTSDGGYIIVGGTYSYGAGWSDVYLLKVDNTGTTQWSKTYGGTNYDAGYSVQQTSDDGYIIAGVTYSYGAGGSDVYLLKVDNTGAISPTSTARDNLDNIIAGPMPFSLSSGKKFRFEKLTVKATVKIYTIVGELVRTLQETDGDGRLDWDLKNDDGETIVQGLYICEITNDKGERKFLKIAIVE